MQTQEMQQWIAGLSQGEGEELLANLHMLGGQLECAMAAIVQRSISSLQDSLHLQQLSCGRLADLRYRSNERRKLASGPDVDSLDSDLSAEIEAASESVKILNSRYSALLKHSGETQRLLAGLYRSYRGFARPLSGTQASLPTWSCEV